MENKLPHRKLLKKTDGAYKYGFFEALRIKHKFSKFFSPINDWDHGWNYHNSDILINYKVKSSYKLGFVIPSQKLKNIYEKFTDNEIILDSLPFYYFCKNVLGNFEKSKNNNEDKLLVFPAKIPFSGLTQNQINIQKNYFDYIKSLEKKFEKIFICIPYEDSFNESYMKLLKNINITYFTGASASDGNSYIRLLQIFSLAKYFTTNSLGSGLVYAGILKKKISISQPIFVPSRNFKDLYIPKKFQYSKNDLAEEYNKIDSIDFINKNYSDLVFSDPYLANEKFDWAFDQIGGKYFISTKKACTNLGLDYKSQIKRRIKNFLWKK